MNSYSSKVTPVILAGGKGTRLKSVVGDRPKVLAEIVGRPFITYLLDQLIESGFKSVVLCTGYKAEMVEKTIGATYKSMKVSYSVENHPLGTFGAIAKASELIQVENIIAMNGDSYISTPLSKFMDWGLNNRIKAGILLTRVNNASRYGQVEVDAKGHILSFREKEVSSKPGLINAGIYILSLSTIQRFNNSSSQHLNSSSVKRLSISAPCSIEKEVFPSLAKSGDLHGYPVEADFIDIGTPDSYKKAKEFFVCR